MIGLEPDELVAGGVLRASESLDALNVPDVVRQQLSTPGMGAYRRLQSLKQDLAELIDEVKPKQIVIEVPSGKAGTGSRHGARGSLTTYGAAAGRLLEVCMGFVRCTVPVSERQWTVGQANKRDRQNVVAAFYGHRYKIAKDKGADASDAIALGRWWLSRATG